MDEQRHLTIPQMTLVITRKFDFLKFLDGIKKYSITHLMYAGHEIIPCVFIKQTELRIVPPQAILLCKASSQDHILYDYESAMTCLN